MDENEGYGEAEQSDDANGDEDDGVPFRHHHSLAYPLRLALVVVPVVVVVPIGIFFPAKRRADPTLRKRDSKGNSFGRSGLPYTPFCTYQKLQVASSASSI